MSRKKAAPEGETETVVPLVSFTGYPDGKTPVVFLSGVTSAPIPDEYAALLRAKKLIPDIASDEPQSPAAD